MSLVDMFGDSSKASGHEAVYHRRAFGLTVPANDHIPIRARAYFIVRRRCHCNYGHDHEPQDRDCWLLAKARRIRATVSPLLNDVDSSNKHDLYGCKRCSRRKHLPSPASDHKHHGACKDQDEPRHHQ